MKTILFLSILIVGLISCPVMADTQIAGGIAVGHNIVQKVENHNGGTFNENALYQSYDNGIYTQNVYQLQQGTGVATLDVGTVEYDRVIKADQVLKIKLIEGATAYYLASGTPLAIYTVKSQDKDAIQSSEAKLEYNAIYDRMDHGIVTPVNIVPYYSTKCSIVPTGEAAYLVIDNRYYPQDAVIQIRADVPVNEDPKDESDQ